MTRCVHYIRVASSSRKEEDGGDIVTGFENELVWRKQHRGESRKRLVQAHHKISSRNRPARANDNERVRCEIAHQLENRFQIVLLRPVECLGEITRYMFVLRSRQNLSRLR